MIHNHLFQLFLQLDNYWSYPSWLSFGYYGLMKQIFLLQLFKWFFCPAATYYASRVYFLNAYLSRIHSESKKLYSVLNSLIARGKVSLAGKRSLLLMIEGLSGRTNRMCYRDSIGSIVEQMDVLTSISATLQLLMLGITFKNIVSGDSNESRPSHSTKYFQTTWM